MSNLLFLNSLWDGIICFLFPLNCFFPPLLFWICNFISCRTCIYGIRTKLFLFSHQIIVWSEMEWWRSINSTPLFLCLYHCFGYERLVTFVISLIFGTLIIFVSFILSSLFQINCLYSQIKKWYDVDRYLKKKYGVAHDELTSVGQEIASN